MSRIPRCLSNAALLGAIVLFSTAASALPFDLTGLIEPCNAGSFGSCVKMEQGTSKTWPDLTSFNLVLDFGSQVGDIVPFEITDLFIPTASGGGTTDVTVITSSPTATGLFNVATGGMAFWFDATINRNGAGESPEFTYVMSTGNRSTTCHGMGPIGIDGSLYDVGTQSVSLVGVGCVNVSAVGDPADFEFMFMSLHGTFPTVPEPTTATLLGMGLVAMYWLRRRRKTLGRASRLPF